MSPESPLSYEQALERARLDPLGAFISVVDAPEEARQGASGPLAGIPYAAKDNIDTVALPTTANTPALAGSTREADNPVVARLKQAGARLVGKTNMHELAFGIHTNAAANPATLNPFDPALSPGGSSGGSGAAVGSGIVPFALATDTGGSATVPAAWCGVYGYRPSMGRWPAGGVAPLSRTRDTVGVIAASLELVRQVDEAVRDSGSAAAAPATIRVGVPKPDSQYLDPLADDVREVWEAAVAVLAETPGIELVAVETDALHELDAECGIGIVLFETQRDLSAYLDALPTPVPFERVMEQAATPDVSGLLAMAYEQRGGDEGYEALMQVRERLRAEWDRIFAAGCIDVLLRPTTPISAAPIDDVFTTQAFGQEVPTFGTVIRNTGPGSLAGQPNVAIPAGIGSRGLPVGVSVEGPRDGDDVLLAIAAVIDGAIGVRSPLLG